MNILLLLDNKINEDQLKEVKKQVSKIYKDNTGIKLYFTDEWRDFSNVPKEFYTKEEEGIKKSYLAETTKEIYSRYKDRIDHVVFFIHKDNWKLTGVWGWNTSKVFNGYGVQQCRFDTKVVNTVGTLYHELMHDHDSFIYTYTGKVIEKMVLVKDWDDDVVHGGRYSLTNYGWKYIRYNENQPALQLIADALKEALAVKRKPISRSELINLALILARQLVTKRRKDLAIKSNNKCICWVKTE